jgi:hypothetical protein
VPGLALAEVGGLEKEFRVTVTEAQEVLLQVPSALT